MSILKTNKLLTTAGDTYNSIIQTQHFSYAVQEAFSSGSDSTAVNTGLSLTIKPKFENSKILVLSSAAVGWAADVSVCRIRLKRTGVDNRIVYSPAGGNLGGVYDWTTVTYAGSGSAGGAMAPNSDIYWLDEPNTLAEITYTLQLSPNSTSGTISLNRYTYGSQWSGVSHITIFEIAQ